MEELQITLRFKIKLSPENNENYKKQLALAYLKPKGIVVYEEDGKIIIE